MDRLRAYAQLLRLPNVFTAWADVCMGWLVAGGLRFLTLDGPVYWSLDCLSVLVASSFIYSAGMVLNDFFDVETDRRERPWRPIPSGRVSRTAAETLGFLFLTLGLGVLTAVGMQALVVGIGLVGSVLLYDAFLKQTWMGPLGMGLCRFLNVLLGVSALSDLGISSVLDLGLIPPGYGIYPTHLCLGMEPMYLQLAGVVGVYIVGVTWFARKEAAPSGRFQLMGATSVMLLAIVLAALLRLHLSAVETLRQYIAPMLLTLWAFIVGYPVVAAIREPSPERVQRAVKTCILGLIGLDACLAFIIIGWPGLLILLLLPPALLLGKWVYST